MAETRYECSAPARAGIWVSDGRESQGLSRQIGERYENERGRGVPLLTETSGKTGNIGSE